MRFFISIKTQNIFKRVMLYIKNIRRGSLSINIIHIIIYTQYAYVSHVIIIIILACYYTRIT